MDHTGDVPGNGTGEQIMVTLTAGIVGGVLALAGALVLALASREEVDDE